MDATAGNTADDEHYFSTSAVLPAERIGFWNKVSTRLFGSLQIDARTSDPFEGEIVRFPLRDCELFSIKSAPASVTRPPGRCSRKGADDVLILQLICSGQTESVIDGRQMLLQAGDFILMDASASNFHSFDEPLHIVTVLLQMRHLADRMHHLRSYLNQPVRAQSGGPAILSKFFRTTWQDMQLGYRPEWSGALSNTIWGLFDLAFPEQTPVTQSSTRRVQLRCAAQQLIEMELCNPDFQVHEISHSLRVSERYIQSLFSDLSTTPSRYLLSRRLELAAEKLRRNPRARIGDIALSVGFSDLAYFSRTFHKRFGMPARAFAGTVIPVPLGTSV